MEAYGRYIGKKHTCDTAEFQHSLLYYATDQYRKTVSMY